MNSNNGYLCEPYITSDWSSVCVQLHGLRESRGSKDYSIILSHSRSIILSHSLVLRADSASDLSNMAFPCCLDFYVPSTSGYIVVIFSRPGSGESSLAQFFYCGRELVDVLPGRGGGGGRGIHVNLINLII